MKLGKLLFLVTAILVLSACQSTTALSPTSAGGPTAPLTPVTSGSKNPSKYQYIFKTPTNPIQLSLELDKAHSAQATIGRSGGQISATGADGTVYALDIPKNALADTTLITMTPLSKVAGMPFDGKASYAVQLEPEGLYLYYDAILTITPQMRADPPNPIPGRSRSFSVTRPRAQTVGLAIPVLKVKGAPDPPDALQRLRGRGWLGGGRAGHRGTVGRRRARAAIESLAAEAIAQMRENQENGTTAGDPQVGQAILDLIDQWEQDVVKPSLEAAGNFLRRRAKRRCAICSTWNACASFWAMRPQPRISPKSWTLAESGAIVCIKEEYQRCVDEHVINRMIPLYIGLLRQHEIAKEGKPGAAEPEGLVLARDLTDQVPDL